VIFVFNVYFFKRADKVSGNEGQFMKKWKTLILD